MPTEAPPPTRLAAGEPIELEELIRVPLFVGVSSHLLAKNLVSVVRRRFKEGDIICREGEYGSTAFYILRGTVEVFLTAPVAHAAKRGEAHGLIRRWTSFLAASEQERRPAQRTIPIDAPVD